MSKKKVKVWECKIIVPDVDLPDGFDLPPRMAVIGAIKSHGIEVITCSSGWGGKLTKEDEEYLNANATDAYPDIYFAGLVDAPEDTAH